MLRDIHWQKLFIPRWQTGSKPALLLGGFQKCYPRDYLFTLYYTWTISFLSRSLWRLQSGTHSGVLPLRCSPSLPYERWGDEDEVDGNASSTTRSSQSTSS